MNVDLARAQKKPDGYFIQYGPSLDHLTFPGTATLAFFRRAEDAEAIARDIAKQGVRARVVWQPPDRSVLDDQDVLLDTDARPVDVTIAYQPVRHVFDTCASAALGVEATGTPWFRLIGSRGYETRSTTAGITRLFFKSPVSVAIHGEGAESAGATVPGVAQVQFPESPAVRAYRTTLPAFLLVTREKQVTPRVPGLTVFTERAR